MRLRNGFPTPTSVKQFQDVLWEELYRIPLDISQNLARVSSRKDCLCSEGKSWSNTILIKKCVQYL
jgi:hypothetical protein